MKIIEAFEMWENEVRPFIVEKYSENDFPALAESWNNFTDMLCKDGELTALQYHYAPAYDEGMPDADIDYILDQLDIDFHCEAIPTRTDGLMSDMPAGTRHFECTFYQGNNPALVVQYSQGPAHMGMPTREEVLQSIMQDIAYADYEFEDFCIEMGYDTDSRTAERIYNAVVEQNEVVQAMFAADEITDLQQLFTIINK